MVVSSLQKALRVEREEDTAMSAEIRLESSLMVHDVFRQDTRILFSTRSAPSLGDRGMRSTHRSTSIWARAAWEPSCNARCTWGKP
jgi:hypothetical protein